VSDARKLRVFAVATYYKRREGKAPRVSAYTRWYGVAWDGYRLYHVSAESGSAAKRIAIEQRRHDEGDMLTLGGKRRKGA